MLKDSAQLRAKLARSKQCYFLNSFVLVNPGQSELFYSDSHTQNYVRSLAQSELLAPTTGKAL